VTEDIEPGGMMFSLWLEAADGGRVPYDFGFDWDGANWQCDRGDDKEPGSPSCAGRITWSNRYDFYNEVDEGEFDDLGDDLEVTYTSTLSSTSQVVSGRGVIEGAAVTDSISRDGWVAVANDLFDFLKEKNLI
jgi:hypothetical protein